MNTKKITLIGLGGVGGYFGFKLAQLIENNPNYEITFVARNETYEIVKKNGLTLLSSEHVVAVVKPDHIINSSTEIEQSDLILICVKEYDLENVCHAIKDKITENTIVMALMNGADIYERIRKIIKNGTFLPSCVYVASHIKQKGIVEHKGNTGKIIIGKDPEHQETDVKWIIDLFQNSGSDVTFKENSFTDIWTKFFFIASFGLVSARYNKSIGEVGDDTLLRQRAKQIMEEIQLITTQIKIDLPADIINKTFEKGLSFPYNTPTSLQLDINSKKQNNELELFAGAIINYGKELGIRTDETIKIYNEINQLLPLATL
jgi:2-dehydropantoate 2-reductase